MSMEHSHRESSYLSPSDLLYFGFCLFLPHQWKTEFIAENGTLILEF